MTELPDAPWAQDLPDAPWAAPKKLDVTPTRVLQQAADLPIIGPATRGINAAINATLAPIVDPLLPDDKGYEKLPEKSFMDRLRHAYSYLSEEPQQFREQHPVVSGVANFGGTAVATGGLGATAAGARLLGMAPGASLTGQAVRGALSGGGISATDAVLRGEDPTAAGLIGGGLGAAGPVVARGVSSVLAGKAASAVSPTLEDLRTAASGKGLGYNHPEVTGLEIAPKPVSDAAMLIHDDLVRGPGANFRPITAPKTFAILDELNVPAGAKSINIADINSAKSVLGGITRERVEGRATPDAVAASRAIRGIDDFLDNLKQPDLIAGDASKAVPILRDAGKNWGALARAEDLGIRLTKAERAAAKSGVGGNVQNAIKQKVSAVLDVPSRSAGYSSAEKAAAEAVVRGSPLENTLRYLGHLGPSSGLGLGLHTATALGTGGASVPASIGLAALGLGAKKLAEHMTATKAAHLEQLLRQRSPLYAQRAATMAAPSGAAPALLQAALRTQALRSASPLPFQQSTPLYFPTQ